MKNKKRIFIFIVLIIILILGCILALRNKSDDTNKLTDYERHEKIEEFASKYDGSNDSKPLTNNESGFIITINNREVLENKLDLDTVLIIQDKLIANLEYFKDIKKINNSDTVYKMCENQLLSLYSIKSEEEFNKVYDRIKKVKGYDLTINEDTLTINSNIVSFTFKLGGQSFNAKFIINLDNQNKGAVFYLS